MNQNKLNQFRTTLLQMRPHLRDEIEKRVEAIPEDVIPPGEDWREPSDALDREFAVEEVQENLYERISNALYRIEVGAFGRCLDCGCEIPSERLEALPYTEYCIECERRRESS